MRGPLHVLPAVIRSQRFFLVLILLLHAIGLAVAFNPIAGIWNAEPLVEQDYALHFHHLHSAAAFRETSGRLWGYNPWFMAGYPSNTIQDASIKFFEYAVPALPFLSPHHAFKWLVILFMLSLPLVAYAAAKILFRDPRTGVVAAALATLYWWNSLPREMFFYGMVGFPIAVWLSWLLLALLYRWLAAPTTEPKKDWRFFISCSLLLVVLPAMHLQGAVVWLPGAVLLLFAFRKEVDARRILLLLLATALSLAVNSRWLAAFAAHIENSAAMQLVEALPVFTTSDPLAFFKDYFTGAGYWTFRASPLEKPLRVALLALGGLGIGAMFRSTEKGLAWTFLALAVGLFALAYAGSLVAALRGWQPLRFKVALNLTLVYPAAHFIVRSFGIWQGRRRQAILGIVIALACAAALVNILRTEYEGRLRIRTGLPEELKPLVAWIRDETPADARVLFEESGDETGFVWNGVYLSAFLPHLTGREIIGGPANLYNDRHHYAEFHSARFLKRDIASFTRDELRSALRIYNIGAVVAFHSRSVNRLTSEKDFIQVAGKIGPGVLMTVREERSWVLEGRASVEADFDRIRVRDAEGETLILKYHWHPWMTAEPEADLAPLFIHDDPIPFIKVSDPPEEFTIRLKGR